MQRPARSPSRLYLSDNLPVFAKLPEGLFTLIYCDPPFFSGLQFSAVSPTGDEQEFYSDSWGGDLGAYLRWISPRLSGMRRTLAEDGSLIVHADSKAVHHLKVLLDSLFGRERFVQELVWNHGQIGGGHRRFPKSHETLLWYAKGPRYKFNSEVPYVRDPYSTTTVQALRKDANGAYYTRGRMLRYATPEELSRLSGRKTYVDPEKRKLAPDVWTGVGSYALSPRERTGFPTQKPLLLMARILGAFSDRGDWVGDFFAGSGSFLVAARRMERHWVGCEIDQNSARLARMRLAREARANRTYLRIQHNATMAEIAFNTIGVVSSSSSLERRPMAD